VQLVDGKGKKYQGREENKKGGENRYIDSTVFAQEGISVQRDGDILQNPSQSCGLRLSETLGWGLGKKEREEGFTPSVSLKKEKQHPIGTHHHGANLGPKQGKTREEERELSRIMLSAFSGILKRGVETVGGIGGGEKNTKQRFQ